MYRQQKVSLTHTTLGTATSTSDAVLAENERLWEEFYKDYANIQEGKAARTKCDLRVRVGARESYTLA